MRGFGIKCKVLRLLTLLAVVCLLGAIGHAEYSNEQAYEKQVLTELEQRMQKRVFIDVNDVPIDMVIRQLADQADVDLVKSPNVTGNVTVTLTDVPLEEALRSILEVHDAGYIAGENIIRILSRQEMPVVTERLTTQIYEIVYADVTEVVTALKEFVSKAGGSVSFVQGTSHIIVTDTESKIKDITDFIEKIDRATPQILVEARIYDITSKDRLDLGIQWEAGRNTTYDATTGEPLITTRSDPFITGAFSGTTSKVEGATAGLRFGWLNPSINVDFLLRAQQQDIDAKLLANPRILVLDNETASIKIISEIPYQELQESSLGGSIGTTAFREVGVELEVTPHLAARDEMIRLHLRPVFSVVTGEVQIVGMGGEYPQPVVDKREADTTLLIKNGHTVVLGGLRKKEVTKQVNKVPLLCDLPLLGALFKFEGEDTGTSELVVFITPWIIEQPTMTEGEQIAFEETNFRGPEPASTRAEASEE